MDRNLIRFRPLNNNQLIREIRINMYHRQVYIHVNECLSTDKISSANNHDHDDNVRMIQYLSLDHLSIICL